MVSGSMTPRQVLWSVMSRVLTWMRARAVNVNVAFFWCSFSNHAMSPNFIMRYPWKRFPPPVVSVTQIGLSRYVARLRMSFMYVAIASLNKCGRKGPLTRGQVRTMSFGRGGCRELNTVQQRVAV